MSVYVLVCFVILALVCEAAFGVADRIKNMKSIDVCPSMTVGDTALAFSLLAVAISILLGVVWLSATVMGYFL